MLESYHKLQTKTETVPKVKDALQRIWFAIFVRQPIFTKFYLLISRYQRFGLVYPQRYDRAYLGSS